MKSKLFFTITVLLYNLGNKFVIDIIYYQPGVHDAHGWLGLTFSTSVCLLIGLCTCTYCVRYNYMSSNCSPATSQLL